MPEPVSLEDIIAALPGPYQPVDVTEVNDAVVRIAQFHGEFPWHTHEDDELFLCWDGSFRVELEDGSSVELNRGDVFVVPAGVEHRPVAEEPAHGIMLERPETLQYGN